MKETTENKRETFHVIRRGIVYELREEPEGGFFITVPALPGCTSFGHTIDEALAKIREATELWLEVARERHIDIPEQFELLPAS